jgi:hypothetical protein
VEQQQLVCTLSCVCRGMRSTVLTQAAGHLSVHLANMLQQKPQQTLNSFARYDFQNLTVRCAVH